MKQINDFVKYAVIILLCSYMASCHHHDLADTIVENVLTQPEYDYTFVINGEKTKNEYRSTRVLEPPSATYGCEGNNFILIFETMPYYLNTAKALSAFEFSILLHEEPEIGKMYAITSTKPEVNPNSFDLNSWSQVLTEDIVLCDMMWAPMCDKINRPEIAKAHPGERIILASNTITDGWLKFDKITFQSEDIACMEITFQLNATATGGDNDAVSIPVAVSKGTVKLHRVVKKSGFIFIYDPWFKNWKSFVPKDYFLSQTESQAL